MDNETNETIIKENTELGEALDNINRDDRLKKLSKISKDEHGSLMTLLCLNHLMVLPPERFNVAGLFMETSVSIDALAREQHVKMVAGHQDTKKNNIFSGLMQRQP